MKPLPWRTLLSPSPKPGRLAFLSTVFGGSFLSPDTLQDILRSLVATGQVSVVKVNGEMVYRVAM